MDCDLDMENYINCIGGIFMTVFEYIKKNITSLNPFVLGQLMDKEGCTLTGEMWSYLRHTPGNTNLNMLRSVYGCEPSGSTDGNVWYLNPNPESFNCEKVFPSEYSKATCEQWTDLYNHPDKYKVSIDGGEFSLIHNHVFTSGGLSNVYALDGRYLHLYCPDEAFDDCGLWIGTTPADPTTNEVVECTATSNPLIIKVEEI